MSAKGFVAISNQKGYSLVFSNWKGDKNFGRNLVFSIWVLVNGLLNENTFMSILKDYTIPFKGIFLL